MQTGSSKATEQLFDREMFEFENQCHLMFIVDIGNGWALIAPNQRLFGTLFRWIEKSFIFSLRNSGGDELKQYVHDNVASK